MASAWIASAARRLQGAGLHFGHGAQSAEGEALWILAHASCVPPQRLLSRLDRPVSAAIRAQAAALVTSRIRSRAPLAYVLGEAWLMGLRFKVDERVIVPRSFIAEWLADGMAPWLEAGRVRSVLDMCTGSGCLAILAAKVFSRAKVSAVDVSSDALDVAASNVRRYRLGQRVRLVQSDLFSNVPAKRHDLIITNPPYVNARSMQQLPTEYRREPVLALAGGRDGLDLVHAILSAAPDFLKPGGILVVEIGHNRKALERAYPRVPFTWLETSAGNEFVFLLTREQIDAGRRMTKTG